jgi:hypothetical protein
MASCKGSRQSARVIAIANILSRFFVPSRSYRHLLRGADVMEALEGLGVEA